MRAHEIISEYCKIDNFDIRTHIDSIVKHITTERGLGRSCYGLVADSIKNNKVNDNDIVVFVGLKRTKYSSVYHTFIADANDNILVSSYDGEYENKIFIAGQHKYQYVNSITVGNLKKYANNQDVSMDTYLAEEDLLEYSFSKPLIVVDVQPQYITSIHFEDELAKYINRRTSNKTLMFFNGDGVTEDDADDVKYWWHENGMQEDTIDELIWVEKEYGYFRSWMDNGISDNVMIKVIRELYQQKVSDTRELFDGDTEQLAEFVGDEWEEWMKGDQMSIYWTDVGLLKQYNGCYICGGGEHQCLREITLLMNAFNIKYTLLNQFIY